MNRAPFHLRCFSSDTQIILRARESHLLAETIKSHPALCSDLVTTAKTAFTAFVQRKLLKALPTPVDPPSGDNEDGLAHFDAILQRATSDAEFTTAAKEKEEKFTMYLASLSKASEAIRLAEKRLTAQEGGAEAVKELVDGAADVLGPYLGETVSIVILSAPLILAWTYYPRPHLGLERARSVLGRKIL
jgi:cysteinyl-tRNA synthetase